MSTFKEICTEARESFTMQVEAGISENTRAAYRDVIKLLIEYANYEAAKSAAKPVVSDYDMLVAELGTAAVAAGQYGASRKQIEYLASLAIKAGDKTGVSSARLTKTEASRLIEGYLA